MIFVCCECLLVSTRDVNLNAYIKIEWSGRDKGLSGWNLGLNRPEELVG